MKRIMLKGKLHRARVTQADLDYEGSITIDKDLMDAADIVNFEKVAVWNITSGSRFETYAIEGERGSGVICVNGAAARLTSRDDLVIIASFCELEESEVANHHPKLVLIDSSTNRVKSILGEMNSAA